MDTETVSTIFWEVNLCFTQITYERNLVGVGFMFSYLCEYLHLIDKHVKHLMAWITLAMTFVMLKEDLPFKFSSWREKEMTWKTDTPLGSGTTRPGTTIERHIMMKCRLCSPSSWSTLRLPSPAPSPPATWKTCPALLFSVSLSTSRSPHDSSQSRGVCGSSVKKGMLEPPQYDFLLGLSWFVLFSNRAPTSLKYTSAPHLWNVSG